MSEQLDALIAAVEVGLPSPTNWRVFKALPVGDAGMPAPILAHRAYHGSLDAAKALHEALMPGLAWGRWSNGHMWVTPDIDDADRFVTSAGYFQDNPARAWLLAILRAYRATQEPPQ